MDEEPPERYAERAFEWWQDRTRNRHTGERHSANYCPCIVCADGRDVLARPAHLPEFALRARAALREINQRIVREAREKLLARTP